MSKLTTIDSIIHQQHFEIRLILDKKLLESIGKNMFVLSLSTITNRNQRLATFELSSDSIIDTSWSSPIWGQFSRIVFGLESCESLGSFLDLVDFHQRLDSHL
jgi:hypothetical protein